MKTVPISTVSRSDRVGVMPNARPSGRIWLEVFGWGLVALLFVGFFLVFRPMPLADDSYQYLNVADNFNHGRGIATSLVHFEMERSHGRMPAPLTTFPPVYPLSIAFCPGSRVISKVRHGS